MKKIISLFAAAAASFLLFAYIDEYENLIKPLFNQVESEKSLTIYQEQIGENVNRTIMDFSSSLSKAYLAGDPSLLAAGLIDDKLRTVIAEEITYLKREGRVMELSVKDLKIEEIRFISSRLIRVSTTETVGLRYLNIDDKKEIITYPDARQDMVYTVEYIMGKQKILSFEVISVQGSR